MKQHNVNNTAIYCRLSRDDESLSDSESIQNQKKMLSKYVEDKGWNIYDIYIDDGYSGTNFDRPDFKRMLKDIENRKINIVVTKDLSRLGRNYIETGHFIEVFFPERHVRYIAVNDSIDTSANDNDILPFKNVLNEMYAKDISKKVRSAFKTKVENGEFIGSFAPYGYKKDPENKNKLVVDKIAAETVRYIFSMFLDGKGALAIARMLNDQKIPNPTMHKKITGLTYINNLRIDSTTYWTDSSVRKILKNQVYIGSLVQGKQRTISFKSKKKITKDENDWTVKENMHEPIVTPEAFNEVQRILSIRRREMSSGETHLFSGKIKCAECGRFMALGRKKNGYRYFACSTWKVYGPGTCTSHIVGFDIIYNVVLEDIRYHAGLAKLDVEALVEKLMGADRKYKQLSRDSIQEEISSLMKRSEEIDGIFRQMYVDKMKGTLTEKRFGILSKEFEQEEYQLSTKLVQLRKQMDEFEEGYKGVNYWLETIKRYTSLKELNKTILNELVERIEVGKKTVIGKETFQDIKIAYKFSGEIR